MKKYVLFAGLSFAIASCTNQKSGDAVTKERDSLLSVINQRESSLNDFIASFTDIEKNLVAVAAKQNIISKSTNQTGELQMSTKDRINAEIAAINDLMDENRKKIADLTKKLKGSNQKNEQFQKMIEMLNDRLAQKDKELEELNDKLASLNAQVALLSTSIDTLNKTVSEQKTLMYTAYYVVGNASDLQAAKVIDRSGGLLGIGKTSRLSSNFDNSKFTRVDYRQFGSLAIDSKKIKIVTTHPSGSYTLDKDKNGVIKSLVISDPQKFWSASKYLVVVKD